MQRARRAGLLPEPQMLGLQSPGALDRERRRPRNGANGRAGARDARRGSGCALLPSRTAKRVRGGAGSMAQRFFSGSGTTPFTACKPAGSGGR